jgi:prepilin-type N-terminal cleavage/methylation domain-containing protein
MKEHKLKIKGFTLIELMIVVAVIGILAGGVLVSMSGSRPKARDARRISDFRQIMPAQEAVMNDGISYQTADGSNSIPAIENSSGSQYLAPMQDLVNGTLGNTDYKYVWVKNDVDCGNLKTGTWFCALAKLEIKDKCADNEYRYFVSNSAGQKEICNAVDYVTNPPDCDVCLAF